MLRFKPIFRLKMLCVDPCQFFFRKRQSGTIFCLHWQNEIFKKCLGWIREPDVLRIKKHFYLCFYFQPVRQFNNNIEVYVVKLLYMSEKSICFLLCQFYRPCNMIWSNIVSFVKYDFVKLFCKKKKEGSNNNNTSAPPEKKIN